MEILYSRQTYNGKNNGDRTISQEINNTNNDLFKNQEFIELYDILKNGFVLNRCWNVI